MASQADQRRYPDDKRRVGLRTTYALRSSAVEKLTASTETAGQLEVGTWSLGSGLVEVRDDKARSESGCTRLSLLQ